MKLKTILMAAALLLVAPKAAQAQGNLGKLAGKLLGGGTSEAGNIAGDIAGDVVGDLLGNLLGTNKLNEKNLVGTWTYSEPCTVLESEDVLSNIGGKVIENKVEAQQKKVLEKVGFKPGKVVLILNEDKTGTMTVGKRTSRFTWAVEESELKLTFLVRSHTINAKLTGGKLQLAMNADKMLGLLNSTASVVGNLSSTMGILSNMLKNYKGLYLGLMFTKN